uniref:Clathrin heavy chain linker domain-containing protein 1 n=2 Tax=Latimeria chalumnae TaxID=7897 RepID=M3XIS1_LATCH|nr:PREDICTED: clathrin heavy chain linker domain-containing protein 1 [Latimeria chalumnae]|eukprot:XP_014347239.1 PREDICTED: clathrin heavy chain linker domain-containing protein 1 [Latimeria chalumnae]
MKKGQKDAFYLQGKLKAMAAEPTTFMYYTKRAIQLQDKIEIINKNSAELQDELQAIRDQKKVKPRIIVKSVCLGKEVDPTKVIPGLTGEKSVDLDALTKHLKQLEKKLKERKLAKEKKYVPRTVTVELDKKMAQKLQQWEELTEENESLKFQHQKLKSIAEAISSCTKSQNTAPLLEWLPSALKKTIDSKDYTREQIRPHLEMFEDDSPSSINEAECLLQYIQRFSELFESGQYELAALYVANCPRGLLRIKEVMEKFKGITRSKEEVPLLLVFFEALMNSSTVVKHPPDAEMTVEGINCALSQNRVDLVIHWVTQQRLTFSEVLGNVIYEYGEKVPQNKNVCLALAHLVYSKCNVYSKAALCMCKLDQFYGAREYIFQCKNFTLDDYTYLLKNCHRTELIQCLTSEWNGNPPTISVGLAVLLLIPTIHKEFGFNFLEEIRMSGQNALEDVILNDATCTPEDWKTIIEELENSNYNELAEEIASVLTSQSGIFDISEVEDDHKIMEHIFW